LREGAFEKGFLDQLFAINSKIEFFRGEISHFLRIWRIEYRGTLK